MAFRFPQNSCRACFSSQLRTKSTPVAFYPRRQFHHSTRSRRHSNENEPDKSGNKNGNSQHKSSIGEKEGTENSLTYKLRQAWKETPVEWYPLPIGVGLAVIGFQQYRHLRNRAEEERMAGWSEEEKREIRASGPWQVHVATALPLKSLSRLWGWFNDLTLPIWLRKPGFRLYAYIFGCTLEDMEDPDLTHYPNLGSFFYRRLKSGVRPIANSDMVSPADGRVLHFGRIEGRRVEQVKGMSYSLDAFFGRQKGDSTTTTPAVSSKSSLPIVTEDDFADVNWIHYSLDELLGDTAHKQAANEDDSKEQKGGGLKETAKQEGNAEKLIPHRLSALDPSHKLRDGYGLFFCVIYLAPGDYHRFHSPVNWIVENRRHFPGELYSVSPYMAKILQNLFVVNERVVLLGHWRHGFFSMAPVGATNVGSIIINFDKEIRTNERKIKHGTGVYSEASYRDLFPRFRGIPLSKGEEIGGFQLGSTVVLVFEAPLEWKFHLEQGQRVKVGQSIGCVETN